MLVLSIILDWLCKVWSEKEMCEPLSHVDCPAKKIRSPISHTSISQGVLSNILKGARWVIMEPMSWPATKYVKVIAVLMALATIFSAFATVCQIANSQPAQNQQTSYSWPMFHHDATFAGYTQSPATNTSSLLWNYTLSSGVMCASPAIVEGRLFIQSEDNIVYCLNATSGAFLWKHMSEGAIIYTQNQYHPNRASPAVANGKVYVGSIDDYMYCLNATTGQDIWKYKTGDDLYSFVTVEEGKVYTGSADFYIYCFEADNGTLVWRHNTGDWPFNPAVADGKVFAGSHDLFFALDAGTGEVLWNYTAESVISDSPCVADGKVFFADGGSPQGFFGARIHCLDANTGTILWSADAPPAVFSSPAYAYGKVFVGSWNGNIYCLNPADGAIIWNYETGDSVASSPAIADGKLYVGSNDGYAYCLNATSGTLLWAYKIGTEVKSSPAIADGQLYITSRQGTVYCFGGTSSQTSGPPVSPVSYELYMLVAAVAIAVIFLGAYLYVRSKNKKS